MAIEKYSLKAQEKFADYLFTVAGATTGSLVLTILLAPLGYVAGALMKGEQLSLGFFSEVTPTWTVAAFLGLYVLVIALVVALQNNAMKIYTRIFPDGD
ncbi:hypothetical protein [Stenotrophomonas sp. PS02298]|uniref:hypothetical protein n=1 Tax=Stenotrophomonas sp. PS02298 TaxID=2991424 RepID=UPI00249A5C6D|nr:hypothetical protein [Stenotrophomonas sp. PS02298]